MDELMDTLTKINIWLVNKIIHTNVQVKGLPTS